MIIRIAKIALAAMIGLFLLLVAVDNLLDYGTNFAFVQHVMMMDTVPSHSRLLSRAILNPTLHQIGYALIISIELLAGVFCMLGVLRLWRVRACSAPQFNAHKSLAVSGLTLAFSLWFFGFMVMGGEWFQMWQSPTWNGQQATFRFIGCVGLVLVFIGQRDEELS